MLRKKILNPSEFVITEGPTDEVEVNKVIKVLKPKALTKRKWSRSPNPTCAGSDILIAKVSTKLKVDTFINCPDCAQRVRLKAIPQSNEFVFLFIPTHKVK